MFSLIVLVWKKRVINQIAQAVNSEHMHFLNSRAAMRRNADFDILLAQQTSQLTAVVAGECDDGHIAGDGSFNGFHDVPTIAARGNGQQNITCVA